MQAVKTVAEEAVKKGCGQGRQALGRRGQGGGGVGESMQGGGCRVAQEVAVILAAEGRAPPDAGQIRKDRPCDLRARGCRDRIGDVSQGQGTWARERGEGAPWRTGAGDRSEDRGEGLG